MKFLQRFHSTTYVVLKEKILSDLVGFVMDTHSFMIEAYNDKIVQLIESGIIGFIWKRINRNYHRTDDSDQTSLSLDHLLIWFILEVLMAQISERFERSLEKVWKVLIERWTRNWTSLELVER
jgi:hypothetical protein